MGFKFFRKNKLDLDFSDVTIAITDAVADDNGEDYVHFLRNRDNTSGWSTTGSSDAANTQLDVEFDGLKAIDTIILVNMNFKNYTIQYYDEDLLAWANFSTSIAVTNNTLTTKMHTFNSVNARQVRLIVTATMTTDDDKAMTQLILTESLGEFTFQPTMEPVIEKSRKVTKYLSGKSHIIRNIDTYAVRLRKNSVTNNTDLTLVETLFELFEGFLVWPSGGETSQFSSNRKGWRLQDIFLMNLSNELEPQWNDSRYAHGMDVDLRLVEVN